MKGKPKRTPIAPKVQIVLKQLRRHGVKIATFAGKELTSVEFFPYEAVFVDEAFTPPGKKKKGDKEPAPQPQQQDEREQRPDALRVALRTDQLPDIQLDVTELRPIKDE